MKYNGQAYVVPAALVGTTDVNVFTRRKITPCNLKECGRWAHGDYCCDRCWLAHQERRDPGKYIELLARSHPRGCNDNQRMFWGEDPGAFVPSFTKRWRSCQSDLCNRPRTLGGRYCCEVCQVADPDDPRGHQTRCDREYEAVLNKELAAYNELYGS